MADLPEAPGVGSWGSGRGLEGLVGVGVAGERWFDAEERIAAAEAAARLTNEAPPGWLGDGVLRQGLDAVPEWQTPMTA